MEAGRPPQAGEEQEYSNATQEEQAIYERVVIGGMNVLYDDATHKDVMKMLDSADPATTLGELVALIISEIDQRNDGRIPDTVILPAAMEIMDAAAELAQTAGLFKVDANMAETAVQILVARLTSVYGIDEDMAKQFLMENVPGQELMPAGQESAQNPMRWQPFKNTPETEGANDEQEPAKESAQPGEEEEEMR
jgi:hypothetical protein